MKQRERAVWGALGGALTALGSLGLATVLFVVNDPTTLILGVIELLLGLGVLYYAVKR